jgi:hypothetical protein
MPGYHQYVKEMGGHAGLSSRPPAGRRSSRRSAGWGAARLAEHAVLITALAQQTRAAGNDSAGARRAATAAKQPAAVDWRTLLVEFLTSRHAQDYYWLRPNPRYAHLGLFLPCRCHCRLPRGKLLCASRAQGGCLPTTH